MRIGNRGVRVLRKHENKVIGVRVELTHKMKVDGTMIYAVVVTNMSTGSHYRLWTYSRVIDAYGQYKKAIA